MSDRNRETETGQEAPAGLASVGATLAAAREEQQRSLESVAADLHLQPAIVRAIETGDEAKLPASTFMRGYVRSYARLLDLDDASLLSRLPVIDDYRAAPLKRVGMRRSGVTLPRGRWFMWVLTLAAVAVMVVYGVPALDRLWSARIIEPASDQLQLPLSESNEAQESAASILLPQPDEPPVAQEQVSEVEPAESVQIEVSEVPAERAELAVDKPSESSQEPADEDAADREQQPAEIAAAEPQTSGPAVVQMRFSEDSWVEIEARGRKLVVGTQAAGSERTVSAEPPIQLLIGNAPGVELSYRGKPVDITPHRRGNVARLTLDD